VFFCIGCGFAISCALADSRVPPKTAASTLMYQIFAGNLASIGMTYIADLGRKATVMTQLG
jgi:hypothetical protein